MAQLPELIKNLEGKIKEIIDKLNIPGILAGIKKQVEEIMKAAGVDFGAAAHCIAAQEKASEKLVQDATNEVEKCMGKVEAAQKDVENLVEKLSEEAEHLMADITAQADKCFKDHGLNIPEVVECLKGLVGPATENVNKLVADIEKAVEDANEIIGNAVNDLTDCVTNVGHNVQAEETQIINDFQQCIDKINNPTTSSSK